MRDGNVKFFGKNLPPPESAGFRCLYPGLMLGKCSDPSAAIPRLAAPYLAGLAISVGKKLWSLHHRIERCCGRWPGPRGNVQKSRDRRSWGTQAAGVCRGIPEGQLSEMIGSEGYIFAKKKMTFSLQIVRHLRSGFRV